MDDATRISWVKARWAVTLQFMLRLPALPSPSEDTTAVGLKTSFATVIKQVLEHAGGVTEGLSDFDQLWCRLKEARRTNQHSNVKKMISSYKALVAKFHSQVQKYQSKLDIEIQALEQEQFQLHHKLPSKHCNTHYCDLLKRRKLVTYVLGSFSMER